MKANKVWNKYICPAIEWFFYGLAIAIGVLALYILLVIIAVM